jgi:hypothetical protein
LPKTVFVQSTILGTLNNAKSHHQYNAAFHHSLLSSLSLPAFVNSVWNNLNPSTTHQTMAPILPTLARASFFSGFSHLYTRSENIFHI